MDPGSGVNVSFDAPALPPGKTEMDVVDTLEVWDAYQLYGSAASFKTTVSQQATFAAAASPPTARPTRPLTPLGTKEFWRVGEAIDPRGITLTTELCQDWLSVLQDDNTFLALRAPVSPTTAVTQSYPLPVVLGGQYSNTLHLISYNPYGPVLTLTLGLRPERITFLENALPSASGERWLSLGVISEPITCPSSLEILPDEWGVESQIFLDLSHQPDNCRGCTLPLYYCYESETSSSSASYGAALALWGALAGSPAGVTSYQGEGITCSGPRLLTLQTWPFDWELGGASFAQITPTTSITLYHYLNNVSGHPISFTLAYTSDLGVSWAVYDDLGQPLPSPFTVNGFQNIRFVSQPLPTDTVPGPYALIITATVATSPTDQMAVSDLLWVGDWVDPPPPYCAALGNVAITGPTSGDLGIAYTFLATASPTTATTPFAYTWQATGQSPVTHTYRYITDTVQFTWSTSGTYAVAVTASNCGNKPTDSTSIVIGGGGPPSKKRVYLPLVLRNR